MPFSHEATAAWPVTGNADKALARAFATRRVEYCLAASEDASDLVVVDPATGVVPLYLKQNGTSYEYDSLDSTTVASAVCLVTNDAKRYKSGGITPPHSVLTVGTTAQPVSPSLGDTYLIPTAATGTDWAGKDGKIGIYSRAGWQFAISPIGRELYAEDTDTKYYRNAAGTWVSGFGAVALGAASVLPSNLLGGGGRERWIVQNQTTNTQPAATDGVAYIIGPSPTGAIWAGNAGKIAHGEGGTWVVYSPAAGWSAYDIALGKDLRYSGSGWQAGADACVLIATQVAANVATIDFQNGVNGVVLDDTYDSYELRISSAKPVSDDVEAWLRVGTGSTPTWITAGYRWNSMCIEAGTTSAPANNSDSKIVFTRQASSGDVGNSAGKTFNAIMKLNNPEQSDLMEVLYDCHYASAANNASVRIAGAGRRDTAGAITAIRFMFESGNIASGRFSLYGYRKA